MTWGTKNGLFRWGALKRPPEQYVWPQMPQTAASDWSSPAAPPGTSIGHLVTTDEKDGMPLIREAVDF